MNESKLNSDLQAFWDKAYQGKEAQKIKKADLDSNDKLDSYYVDLGDSCNRILDVGCGISTGLLAALIFGHKASYGQGLDTSPSAVAFMNKTCSLSGFKNLDFVCGGLEALGKIPSGSFDGLACSNVLDVIPEATSDKMIAQMLRILPSGGFLLLKFNFYLTPELIEQIHMEKIGSQSFAKNGILRGVNRTLEEWEEKLKGFREIKRDSYARLKNGPEDRILWLQKD